MAKITKKKVAKVVEKPEAKPLPPVNDDQSEDDSSSTDEGPEWTADDEKAFLKTLGALKSNKTSIYDEKTRFWNESDNQQGNKSVSKVKAEKAKPMYLKDYERKLILEKGGKVEESDEEEEDEPEKELGYYEQQIEIRKQFSSAVANIKEEDTDSFLIKREKTNEDEEKEEADFYDWLKDKEKNDHPDTEIASLKKVWENPQLEDADKFLRDYLLNKDYETDGKDAIPTYEEIVDVDEDEEQLERELKYEQKYNFRFEDPDQEFIKQYPRTVNESLRKDEKKTKRKEKREQTKEKKLKEKKEKISKIKSKQKDTRLMIESKLAQLRELAGEDIPLSLDDLKGDFDPAEYDRRMNELFNNKYYGDDANYEDNSEEKPVFSDMEDMYDDDGDFVENVPKGGKTKNRISDETEQEPVDPIEDGEGYNVEEPYEDEDNAQPEPSRRRKESKRKMKRQKQLEASKNKKPLFDPSEKTFEEYFNEYYGMECEDIIGDQPTRFKYRQVVPNNFGLNVDEILDADEKELNSWASLRKAIGYRTEQEERYDVQAYDEKSRDTRKKQRILRSLYEPREPKPEVEEPSKTKKVKKAKTGKLAKAKTSSEADSGAAETEAVESGAIESGASEQDPENNEIPVTKPQKVKKAQPKAVQTPTADDGKKKARRRKRITKTNDNSAAPTEPSAKKRKVETNANAKGNAKEGKKLPNVSDDRLRAYGLNPKKFKAKLKYGKKKEDTLPLAAN